MDGALSGPDLIQGLGVWLGIKVFVATVEKLVKQTDSIVTSYEVAT